MSDLLDRALEDAAWYLKHNPDHNPGLLRERLAEEIARLQASDDGLGEIHRICADAGIPPGDVGERVRKLAENFIARAAARKLAGVGGEMDAELDRLTMNLWRQPQTAEITLAHQQAAAL